MHQRTLICVFLITSLCNLWALDLTFPADTYTSKEYIKFIKKQTKSLNDYDQELAFVAAQRLIEESIINSDWQQAISSLQKLKSNFTGIHQTKIDEFISLLSANLETKIQSTTDSQKKKSQILNTKLAAINSDGDEYKPALSLDGKKLFFTGKNRSDNIGREDIFVSKMENNGKWGAPTLIEGDVNSEFSESIQSISSNGETIYYSGSYEGNFGKTDIYYSSSEDDSVWQKPYTFLQPINTQFYETGAHISSDGQALFFCSDRGGGIGNYVNKGQSYHGSFWGNFDIYVCLRQKDGNWGQPINLGDQINTPYCEYSPFFHADGETLYFSSDGHAGIGRLDIFMTIRLDDTWKNWSKPKNLGKNINTVSDDWGLKVSTDGMTAYFAANDSNTFSQNIYAIILPDSLRPKNTKILKGAIFNEENVPVRADSILLKMHDSDNDYSLVSFSVNRDYFEIPIQSFTSYDLRIKADGYIGFDTTLTYYDLRDKVVEEIFIIEKLEDVKFVKVKDIDDNLLDAKVISKDIDENLYDVVFNENNNYYVTKYNLNKQTYIIASADGFMTESKSIHPNMNNQRFELSFLLKSEKKFIDQNDSLVYNFFFKFDSYELAYEAFDTIAKISKMLNKSPTKKFVITGHTDSKGSPTFNKKLSLKRAKTIRDRLVYTFKCDSSRIDIYGMGDTSPLYKNDTEENRAKNRRVVMSFQPLKFKKNDSN